MNLNRHSKESIAKNRNGWTLVEMMISVGLGAVIMAAVASTYIFSNRTLDATANYAELDRQSRNALDKVTGVVREVAKATSISPTSVDLQTLPDAANHFYTVTFRSNNNTLEYIGTNGTTTVLLKGCSYFHFSYFQRTPLPNTTMLFNPASSADDTKVIIMDWVCKKTNYMSITDSESIQTAKVVLRN
ncbi:PilW family protein [Pedosphaera parvula]|uniref:Prepilin-type N-terminal cleavage/methylation domain-containing protein n=1 Tax=Pedosphaera parvula (strain Ellin514) TaxID=320771 RepID=B9XF97_PEDPL|nr:prepilin-type N-terminal cleavage/methylation domain-containing protein [Pedosphaera parvula]EEF61595.1 hypothetical protein Cflav_PD4274 [Pedosphaera parvula Ellin514]